jgi:hypothetical protein
MLERAVRSALNQDYPALEVVVSDNGSSDGTEETLRRLAAEDSRVRYSRQPHNHGHAANFRRVFEMSRGEYFMWLSDDDEIEPAYVRRCLEALEDDPGLVGACGRGRYHRNGQHVVLERAMTLRSRRPSARVLRYFAQVTLNGALSGVFRRTQLEGVPFRGVMAGDWVLVGALAARGRFQTLEDVHILRSLSGVSTNPTELAREFGRVGLVERYTPHVGNGWIVFRHVAWDEPAYALLGRRRRLLVAAVSGALIAARFTSVTYARLVLDRLHMLGPARRLIAPLRAHRHRPDQPAA